MAQQSIEIGLQTPIAAASALKKAGYAVTSGGKPVNVSETDESTEQELTDGKGAIHTKKWDRCVKKVKASGKSEESAYKICSSSIKNAGVQKSHQQKKGKQYVANRQTETNEGQTMFDIFPELNQCEPQDGGEVKDIKMTQKHITSAPKPKEEKPKKVNRDPKMEGIITKKELLNVIREGAAQPAPSPGTAPTETPTIAPTKPGQKPERQNPFRPKPGTNPKPKGAGQPAPSPGTAPTETPTIAPTKPAQRPERQNPFRPKPGTNPKPKGEREPETQAQPAPETIQQPKKITDNPRQNPKPGPTQPPRQQSQIPDWLSSDALGLGRK